MKKPMSMIITGYGANCEAEMKHAYELAKAEPRVVHITDILDGDHRVNDAQILNFIGGFVDGDHLGAGTVQAARFRHRLRDDLSRFIESGKPIIGICNGDQILVKMGLLPGFKGDYHSRLVTLMNNDSGKFEDRWVYMKVNMESPCIWTQGIRSLFLPVRHGEGKLYAEQGVIDLLFANNQVVFQYVDRKTGKPTMDYPQNPSGTLEAIAGICNEKGTILGMMPHPEAFLSPYNHPEWTYLRDTGRRLPKEGQGVQLFRNAVKYVRQI